MSHSLEVFSHATCESIRPWWISAHLCESTSRGTDLIGAFLSIFQDSRTVQIVNWVECSFHSCEGKPDELILIELQSTVQMEDCSTPTVSGWTLKIVGQRVPFPAFLPAKNPN